MPFFRAKKLDFASGHRLVVVIRKKEAIRYGMRMADVLKLVWKNKTFFAIVNYTYSKVHEGEIGLFKEICDACDKIKDGDVIEVSLIKRPDSIKAIRKKLLGANLSYKEIYSIISDVSDGHLGNIETTYFVASSFRGNFSDKELYYLTKAMVETGNKLKFKSKKKVVDKHSVGGLPGNRVTPILVPIIASLGFTIPKTSSRAITSPAGTADTLEVFMPVQFGIDKIKDIVKKTNGCLIWGGALNLAPADDKIIKVSYPLGMEPYNKMIVSIMAKKISMGVKYLIIDMPLGSKTKIKNQKAALMIERKMKYITDKFGLKLKVVASRAVDPSGRGIGPALEARDVLRVLQQKDNRPDDLEKKAIKITSELLVLTGEYRYKEALKITRKTLHSGQAWKKMQEIIEAQGGNPDIDSEDIVLGEFQFKVKAEEPGKIAMYDNKAIGEFCRVLGAPSVKVAGIYLDKVKGNTFKKGEALFTLYTNSPNRLKLAKAALKKMNILKINPLK